MKQFLRNLLQWASLTLNAWTRGDPEETLSSRMGKSIRQGRCKLCRPVCWLLAVVLNDPDHCGKAADLHPEEGKDEVVRL